MRSKKNDVDTLASRLADMLDDGTDDRWAVELKYEAINLSISAVWPRWNETIDIYPFATYSKSTFDYAIPEGVDDVIAVYIEPNSTTQPWWVVRQWHVDGDRLYIHDSLTDYDGQKMRVVCVRAPWELLLINQETGTDGVIAAGENYITSASSNFLSAGVKPGDDLWLYTGCEDVDKKHWIIKAVDINTLSVYGEFQKAANGITFYVNGYTYVPEMYILHKAASELFQLSGHKGAGQDITENMQWAEFHAQMAEFYIGLQGKAYPSKRTA